jgi:pimeloyl-ACP methyl ester carboxylesterase
MIHSPLWTPSRARLRFIHQSKEGNLNWLFLPGGPGLGSESLLPLINLLQLPGNCWCFDLPGDGSNTTSNNGKSFSHWPKALIEGVKEFEHVILVAHSTGGMYALSLPELEKHLKGLVLLGSAPNAKWQTAFAKMVTSFPLSNLEILQENYRKNPSTETLKALTLASAPYLFTPQGQSLGIQSLLSLPYNYETCQWSEEHFDSTYQCIPFVIQESTFGRVQSALN